MKGDEHVIKTMPYLFIYQNAGGGISLGAGRNPAFGLGVTHIISVLSVGARR